MTAVWGIVFLVALFGCLPYGAWLIYTALKKRWNRLALVAFLLLTGVSWITNALARERYLEELFDTKVKLGDPIFECNSERAFNGDGYSISVYELPSTIRARFEAVDERLLSSFPKHPAYRHQWRFERWRRSPFDEKFNACLEFALSGSDADRFPGLSEQFESIRKTLSRAGAYYAFFYSRDRDNPGDIDLFIVDLAGNRLYSINHNT